jgi:hypothetical protein
MDNSLTADDLLAVRITTPATGGNSATLTPDRDRDLQRARVSFIFLAI